MTQIILPPTFVESLRTDKRLWKVPCPVTFKPAVAFRDRSMLPGHPPPPDWLVDKSVPYFWFAGQAHRIGWAQLMGYEKYGPRTPAGVRLAIAMRLTDEGRDDPYSFPASAFQRAFSFLTLPAIIAEQPATVQSGIGPVPVGEVVDLPPPLRAAVGDMPVKAVLDEAQLEDLQRVCQVYASDLRYMSRALRTKKKK